MSLTLRVSLHRAELTFTDIQALTGSRRCFRLQLQPLRAPPVPACPHPDPSQEAFPVIWIEGVLSSATRDPFCFSVSSGSSPSASCQTGVTCGQGLSPF